MGDSVRSEDARQESRLFGTDGDRGIRSAARRHDVAEGQVFDTTVPLFNSLTSQIAAVRFGLRWVDDAQRFAHVVPQQLVGAVRSR